MAATIIDIKAPADIVTPAAGTVELFLDSTNGNKLSYMDSTRTVTVVQANTGEDCCACEIEKNYWCQVTKALNKGLLSASQFQAIVTLGFNVTATDDGAGNCSITTGVTSIAPTSISINGDADLTVALEVVPFTLSATILPANATNQGVIWVSSNPARATVDQNGLVTVLSSGTVYIFAYSAGNPSLSDSVFITILP